jgi:hypothetical protein
MKSVATLIAAFLGILFFEGFKHQLKLAQEKNSWFTKENILFSLESWSNALTEQNLQAFVNEVNINNTSSKKVAVIMAGNIPLVGFHDFLSVLISGHSVIVKQSSSDKHLLPFLAKFLEYVEHGFKGKITFTEEKLTDFDAVIATGSNNTARYFDYYFKNIKNNYSVFFLSLLAVIGQLNIINSFAHIYTPLLISLLRTVHGLWIGLLLGLAAVLVIRYLINLTQDQRVN